MRKVLEKAESEGGDEWLRQCLAMAKVNPACEAEATEQLFPPRREETEEVTRPANLTSAQCSPARRLQQRLPSERLESEVAVNQRGRSCPTEDDRDDVPVAQRIKRRRRVFSPSTIRSGEG